MSEYPTAADRCPCCGQIFGCYCHEYPHLGNPDCPGMDDLARLADGLAVVVAPPTVLPSPAVFSPCRTYRYALERVWDHGPKVAVVGLNPSTADETHDDQTIRKLRALARRWGFGGLLMVNLFAFCATDPDDMLAAAEPVGPRCDEWLHKIAGEAQVVVAAWGVNGGHRGRDRQVRELLPGLCCLGLTKHGHPRHPLYLPNRVKPLPWPRSEGCEGGEG